MPAPLFARAPDLDNPILGVRVWFVEPGLVVNQVYRGESMTAAIASYLTTVMEEQLQQRFVSQGRKVRYLHDWRDCVSYEADARQLLVDWGRASRLHTERVDVGLSPKAGSFLRIATLTAMTVLRAVGMKIDLIDDVEAACRALPTS